MNKKQVAQAKLAHNKFLKRMGCLPEQLKERKTTSKRHKLELNYAGTATRYFDSKPLSDVLQGDTNTGTKHDIISNLYKESPAVQALIREKSSRIGILVNKSGYGVITPGMDPKTLGRK
jgi:hypothetical protein